MRGENRRPTPSAGVLKGEKTRERSRDAGGREREMEKTRHIPMGSMGKNSLRFYPGTPRFER